MSRNRLVCARCGTPVAEARCASCRHALDQMREHARRVALAWAALVSALLAVLYVSLVAAHA